jgi:hypothetical protein
VEERARRFCSLVAQLSRWRQKPRQLKDVIDN